MGSTVGQRAPLIEGRDAQPSPRCGMAFALLVGEAGHASAAAVLTSFATFLLASSTGRPLDATLRHLVGETIRH
jgi:hypothetical protein